jgi:glucose-6-phosphate-specific signal transduction histidine kinase
LKEADGRITLDVKDNGRGISREEISNSKSMGLLGMRERAALLGGIFKIGRLGRGKGTRVSVSMPVPSNLTPINHEDSINRRSRSSTPRIETDPGGGI